MPRLSSSPSEMLEEKLKKITFTSSASRIENKFDVEKYKKAAEKVRKSFPDEDIQHCGFSY